MDAPVETEHAIAARDTHRLHHDVITRLAVVIGVVALAIKHVVANDGTVKEKFRVLPGQAVKALATFNPVVTLIAHQYV